MRHSIDSFCFGKTKYKFRDEGKMQLFHSPYLFILIVTKAKCALMLNQASR